MLDVYCGALKPRAEVVSAGGRRPGRRIFIAASQADGRRGGFISCGVGRQSLRHCLLCGVWFLCGMFFVRREILHCVEIL